MHIICAKTSGGKRRAAFRPANLKMRKPAMSKIKIGITAAALLLAGIQGVPASESKTAPEEAESEITELSRQKWQWMSDKKNRGVGALFHEKSAFVHMGGSMDKESELGVIKSGAIHYKKAEIFGESVRIIGDTAILLGKVRLLAAVGGREVTNPFIVTEVYVRQKGEWKLASLSFTRLLEDFAPNRKR